jgi:hypothetical protein
MACVRINPRYVEVLQRQGLIAPEDFLDCAAIIISGHPDRHVCRMTLGSAPDAPQVFIKREHRVPWKERIASACAGFGWATRSDREAAVLNAVRAAGIGAPEVIATGQDDKGRAFLMVRDLRDAVDLRLFLSQQQKETPRQRCCFFRRLGETLARVHALGFDHPDLYSKHVLVDPKTGEISLLDWQRSRRGRVGFCARLRDLGALHATVAEGLANARDRLRCLRAYLAVDPNFWHGKAGWRTMRREVLARIERRAKRLQRRRRIREMQQAPLAFEEQNLIWLDGEALCVTCELQELAGDAVATWLAAIGVDKAPRRKVTNTMIRLPNGCPALLKRRQTIRPWAWLMAWLGRSLTSPDLSQAGMLFRLQRSGIDGPRLLAVGHRPRLPGIESFLLIAPPAGAVDLAGWLAQSPRRCVAEHKQRWRIIRCAADLVRRLHATGYCWGDAQGEPGPRLVLVDAPEAKARVALGSLAGLRRGGNGARDLAVIYREWAGAGISRSDRLRFLLAYLRVERITPEARAELRGVMVLALLEPACARGMMQEPVGSRHKANGRRPRTALRQGATP